MKFASFLPAVLALETSSSEEESAVDQEKTLKEVIMKPTQKRSAVGLERFGINMGAFDYGCHCSALLSGKISGYGAAVDALDMICKDYLECTKCVQKVTNCQVSVNYDFVMDDSGVVCTENDGTCEKNICECDAMFYRDLLHAAYSGIIYNYKYNVASFDPSSSCHVSSRPGKTSLEENIAMDARFDSSNFLFEKEQRHSKCCSSVIGNSLERSHSSKLKCCELAPGKFTLKPRC
ncbi:Oidioi.mRNA.OKI2018_I69.chr1.g373.t1.cds [Oikopleura dioica]|uniref:Oidioi.mRNA.OKI2018_I69.chr1.g373.t1.cds n=1 Tax=Oikopleura dioica TaxID=34765 RepID=A0ABN7SK48_OIKDI|nr:Oidioi.mRNA.OKI2018_I69.chr1.g373.t1.cds [Oikopleura dioica]